MPSVTNSWNNSGNSRVGAQMDYQNITGGMNFFMDDDDFGMSSPSTQRSKKVDAEPKTAAEHISTAEELTEKAEKATRLAAEALKKETAASEGETADKGESVEDNKADKSDQSVRGSPTASDTVDGHSTDDENDTHDKGGFFGSQQSSSGTTTHRVFNNSGNKWIAQQVGSSNVSGASTGKHRARKWY